MVIGPRKLTQSRTDNCWQTCVAMLLGVSAEALPAQHLYDRERYGKLLRVYLDKHHSVTYAEIPVSQVSIPLGFHLLIGESPRTSRDNPSWHAIVGKDGAPYWDVNPSRAGLTSIEGYGVLIATPPEWRETWKDQSCACPACIAQKSEAA